MAPHKQVDPDRLNTLISSLTSSPPTREPVRALRRRAEDKARESLAWMPANLEAFSPEKIQETFHELRVHQIELEMQNDELCLTQAELENARNRYFKLFNLAPVGYCILSEQELILEANLTAATLLGASPDDLADQPLSRFVCKGDRDFSYLFCKQIFATGTPQTCELQMIKGDGTTFWARLDATAAQDENGTAVCRIMLNDITAAKQVEEALRQSEQRANDAEKLLQLVINSIPIRLFWKDRKGVYLGCNRLFAQDAGFEDPKELIGTDDSSLGRKEGAEIFHRDDVAVMTSGTPRLHAEEMYTTPNGHQLWMSTSKVPLRDAHDKIIGVLGTYEDVTQRKRADQELLKSQKIEALGLMAGGIAHNFNNILMIVMGNISFAKMVMSPDHQAFDRLTFAETALLRAKELTQQFLTFSKGGDPVKKSISCAHLIKVYGQFSLCGAKSTCEYLLADDLWNIEADDGQMGQVLTNLLHNADQSMPEGGVITLTCQNVVLRDQESLPLPNGQYVKISIKDQGGGITEQNLGQIFDPYFTTKEVGRGLGLAAAHSIIKKHAGYIAVESTPDAGTTVSIFLPASPALVITPPAVQEPELITGKGSILVMDDDQLVLKVVEAMLERLGYQVTCAGDGKEALAKYVDAQQAGQPFDAVIMDLIILGGMGGEEAIEKLLAIDPQARVIVSSGYSYDPVMADYKSYGFRGVIAKPYLLTDLSKQMQQILAT